MALTIRGLELSVPGRELLREATLGVNDGECVAVVGPSGSGKTSLLTCISGMLRPDSGEVGVGGVDVWSLSTRERAALRLAKIGVVFQFGELLPELTALQNVALPLRLLGVSRHESEATAGEWLTRVSLDDLGGARPEDLSGGEQQRVGIARALAKHPALVLADEPTGMLDVATTRQVAALLVDTSHEERIPCLVTTHDPVVAAMADRTVTIAAWGLERSTAREVRT